ncbi:MAG: cyclic nucleotide-binding domain-containing protein [Myxococcales bacterium]|nr:cyclic nucleotide-binding domain-containing protein [Myxococcales bacterium]
MPPAPSNSDPASSTISAGNTPQDGATVPSPTTPAYSTPSQSGAGSAGSARPIYGMPSTSRGGTVSTTESDVVGTLPTAQAPQPYGSSAIGRPISQPSADPRAARPTPVSQPGHDPAAPRPSFDRPRPISQPAYSLAAPPRPITRPANEPYSARAPGPPMAGSGRLISHAAHDPSRPVSHPAHDPGRPVSGLGHDPFAAVGRGAPVSRTTSDPFQPQGPHNAPRPQSQQPAHASQPGAVIDPEFWALARGMAFSPSLVESELHDLAAIVGRKVVEPGQTILKQGQPADQGAIVGSGVGHMNYATPGRQPVDFGEIQPGDIIGDGAVSGGGYHGCTVIADSACVVWTFSAAQMVDLNRRNPALTAKLKGLVLLQQGRR